MGEYLDHSQWQQFSAATCRALFEAVEIDDIVDDKVNLPKTINLDCAPQEMQRCFALCLQFWQQGFARQDLLNLVTTLQKKADLNANQRRHYKHIRAKYKHLRFALMLYTHNHKVPKLFGATVAIMGHLQDSFRNNRRLPTLGYAWLLRVLLTKPIWNSVNHAVQSRTLTTSGDFRAYRQADMKWLKNMLYQPEFTGPEFHAMRKVVSKQVSFYDTLRSLEPSDHSYQMSRYLSTINGLMGNCHDIMVLQAGNGERDYNSPQPLEDDIRWRLETLVAAYPTGP
ncbi:hypothetical protein [Sphingopyxis yananensis]|uniref:hypothetical protein n=1 Tax=Sphingopyxis yananensis TaxID=2886687 RepID=UPI001D10424F|nr:hypothetical protein [Sphingopyxis yananensis]MCC2603173.1 hypothetical protein [Sphingopyxis yananensis]